MVDNVWTNTYMDRWSLTAMDGRATTTDGGNIMRYGLMLICIMALVACSEEPAEDVCPHDQGARWCVDGTAHEVGWMDCERWEMVTPCECGCGVEDVTRCEDCW